MGDEIELNLGAHFLVAEFGADRRTPEDQVKVFPSSSNCTEGKVRIKVHLQQRLSRDVLESWQMKRANETLLILTSGLNGRVYWLLALCWILTAFVGSFQGPEWLELDVSCFLAGQALSFVSQV